MSGSSYAACTLLASVDDGKRRRRFDLERGRRDIGVLGSGCRTWLCMYSIHCLRTNSNYVDSLLSMLARLSCVLSIAVL